MSGLLGAKAPPGPVSRQIQLHRKLMGRGEDKGEAAGFKTTQGQRARRRGKKKVDIKDVNVPDRYL
ncbi:MAG: hypothetical protein AMJ84_00140 [Acidithiobacillales bacterium SM23_46]|nr:MAG: hypothetical protein AMJ84_00140 [Acidithiobacillales bacterium SM23_46]KPL29035.1 MAG: hypothetical protein AMJ72_00310 [Acidithiobacillales bacterium SM1_46]